MANDGGQERKKSISCKQKEKKEKKFRSIQGATRGLNPGPLASDASGVTLSENHTTRPAALVSRSSGS